MALATSHSESLTENISPDPTVIQEVHVTQLTLIFKLPNKSEYPEILVDDFGKRFDNGEVNHENLGEIIDSDRNWVSLSGMLFILLVW